MKYINLGCGQTFSKESHWTNVDFHSYDENVIQHNLLNGIPFNDTEFDVLYHSHVLEHFAKNDAVKFLKECFRVLKKNGVIRIAIPDLGNIINHYKTIIGQLNDNPNDEILNQKYDWIILELFDQIVRNYSGGEMGDFLIQNNLKVEDFIKERVGNEAIKYREWYYSQKNNIPEKIIEDTPKSFLKKINFSKKRIPEKINNEETIGKFRLGGEVHQWMYDSFSIVRLLKQIGFQTIELKSAFESNIPNWEEYQLDVLNSEIRKPDSLYVEARKL